MRIPLKNEATDFFHRDEKALSSRWKLFFTAMRNDCHRDEKSLRVEGKRIRVITPLDMATDSSQIIRLLPHTPLYKTLSRDQLTG